MQLHTGRSCWAGAASTRLLADEAAHRRRSGQYFGRIKGGTLVQPPPPPPAPALPRVLDPDFWQLQNVTEGAEEFFGGGYGEGPHLFSGDVRMFNTPRIFWRGLMCRDNVYDIVIPSPHPTPSF